MSEEIKGPDQLTINYLTIVKETKQPEQKKAEQPEQSESEKAYIAQLYKDYDYGSTEFDKSLTYISSGVLGVSYAFIDKVVPLKSCHFKGLLIQGWILLSIAIFLSLLGHYASVWVQKLLIRYALDIENKRKIYIKGEIITQAINIGVMTLILIGSINILNFIKINL